MTVHDFYKYGLAAAAFVIAATAFAPSSRAQSISDLEFSAFGSIPRTVRPKEPERIPYRKNGRRIDFYVNPETMRQQLSDNLSHACQNGRFNQKKNRRLFVDVPLSNGSIRRFGYADSRGFNLNDPDKRVGANQVYLFDFEGTSECEVYAFATIF